MSKIKEYFLYVLALVVLLAPAIILGWIGLTLLGWVGLVLGIMLGLVIFAFSVNKIAAEEAEEDADEETEAVVPSESELETAVNPPTLEETVAPTASKEGR